MYALYSAYIYKYIGMRLSKLSTQGRFKSLAAFVKEPRDPMIFLHFQN